MIGPGTRPSRAARLLLALVVVGAAVACTAAPGGSGPAETSPAVASSARPTSVPATPDASPSPLPSPSVPSVPPDAEPSLEAPPAATLVAGGDSHPGEPGSWAWAGGTSDAPWLPAQALERADVPPGDVTVELDEGVEIESWTAVAATADDVQGVELEQLGDGSGEPSFRVASGEWVVAVDVRFADGLGSTVYFWRLVAT